VLASLLQTLRLTRATLHTALRGVVANRMRAFLSTLGIAIGVATLIAIFGLVQGLTETFTRQIAQLGANTMYVTSRPWIIEGDWWRYRNRPPITKKDVAALRDQGKVLKAIAPVAFSGAEVSYQGESLEQVSVRGSTNELIDASTFKLDAGRFLSALDVELDTPVVVVGSDIRELLFHGADPVGSRILVAGRRFTVIGVLAPQGKSFGQSLDNLVIIPLDVFGGMFGFRRDLSIAVTAEPENLSAAEEEIVEILRRTRGLPAEKDDTFSINRQSELANLFKRRTETLFGVAIAIGVITLLVGGIGVMNIMLVAVTERTREIGVRRALGARQRTILFQFIIEAMLVTLLGGVVGIAIGMGGAEIVGLISPLEAKSSPEAAILGIVMSAVVGLAFGAWPAYRAAKLDPIESLRYE
jgi:putative ABC transport system permease protein